MDDARPRGPIARAIVARAAEIGWSQAELVRRSGLKKTTLASIYQGKVTHPRADTMRALARAFACRVEDLAGPEAAADFFTPESTGDASRRVHVTLAELHLAMATERYDDAAELNGRLADEINRLRGRPQRKGTGAQRVTAQTDQ